MKDEVKTHSDRRLIASPLMDLVSEPGHWSRETLYFEGDAFYQALIEEMDRACLTIDLETYIFDSDQTGARIMEALVRAGERGVSVRVLVDGVGSPYWLKWVQSAYNYSHLNARVYKPIPYPFSNARAFARFQFKNILRFFSRINRRNHRKSCLIDKRVLFLGSHNITNVHSAQAVGGEAWKDISARLEGDGLKEALHAFNWAWRRSRRAWKTAALAPATPIFVTRYVMSELLRLNHLRKLRRHNFKKLLRQINHACSRIWLGNPYFVPDRRIMRALMNAARRGVDVKVLVPRKSDVKLVRWASTALYGLLIPKGVQIYEYLPRFYHAKIMMIDDWMTVGSSNLNHRSVLHDLEVDACLQSADSRKILSEQYLQDLTQSERIQLEKWNRRNLWQKLLGRLALVMKYWI